METSSPKTFLFLHGWQGSGPEHWQHWLADKLTDLGHTVLFPEFPNADFPELPAWKNHLEKELQVHETHAEITVLSHSVGGILWCHYLLDHPEWVSKTRSFFIAPAVDVMSVPEIKSFYPCAYEKIGLNPKKSFVFGSENDPYVLLQNFVMFSEQTKIPFLLIPGGLHLSVAAGHGPWPELLAAVLGKKSFLP